MNLLTIFLIFLPVKLLAMNWNRFRSSTSTAAAAFAIATSASSNPRDDTYEHSTIKESDERNLVSSPATIRVLNVLRCVFHSLLPLSIRFVKIQTFNFAFLIQSTFHFGIAVIGYRNISKILNKMLP